MKLKVGNSVNLIFAVTDFKGVVIGNLVDATNIKFMVKINETDIDDDALISKVLNAGITINTPTVGSVLVSLTALDTTVPPGVYFVALQIEWSTSTQEIEIKESFSEINSSKIVNFIQDIIR